jgi:KUP system potassium uptake protein
VEQLAENFVRVTANFGFMEKLSIRRIVTACDVSGLKLDDPDTTYYVADPQIVPKKRGRWRAWRRNLFVYMKRNANPITSSLGIPADELAKLGIEVPM